LAGASYPVKPVGLHATFSKGNGNNETVRSVLKQEKEIVEAVAGKDNLLKDASKNHTDNKLWRSALQPSAHFSA
jgi:hypothetical protein